MACRAWRAQGRRDQPRRLPRELAQRAATAVLTTGVQLMVTANPGRQMQLATTRARIGERMPVAKAARVLDPSIRGAPVGRLLAEVRDGLGRSVSHCPRTTASTR
jgi:glycolate oxidase iron-sulfur subunit